MEVVPILFECDCGERTYQIRRINVPETHTLHPEETEYSKRCVTTYKTLFRIECGRPDAGDWQHAISEQLRRAGFEHHPSGFPTLEQAVEYLDHYVNKRINNATSIT